MRELDLLDRRMSPFEVLHGVKELGIFAQGARNSAKAADVLRVSPPGVVAPTIAMGDEGSPHFRWREGFGLYSTGRRRRSDTRKVEPFFASVDEIGADSSRISHP